ncbi:MAG: efflux transporter outer membrane subunit [Gallionellaceae bacterium]|nr:efflux transporter outer membrane subunit [Gallionellaceae bacterium]
MNLKITSAILSLFLAGCAMGPDYKRPAITLPPAYSEDTATANQSAIANNWWALYGDATLTGLVTAALNNNADILKSLALLDEAEAVLSEADASFFPQLDLGTSGTKSRSSTLNAQRLQPGTPIIAKSNRLALSTAFELDFWGKLRRNTEAAHAQVRGTRYAKDVTSLTIAGLTTQAYFTLCSLDAQIAVSKETATSREESLAVMKNRAAAGLASELELNQAEGVRADVSLQLRELQRQRALIEHQLGNLTGQPGLKIIPVDLSTLPVPALPSMGLPSALIEQRPDVQQAEQKLVFANAQIGLAKAAMLPTFSLTGNYGGQSEALSNLFKDGARIWSAGLSATLPIFDAGKYAARTHQTEARQRQALADYQKSVETAFKEVADALSNMQQSTASATDQQTKTNAARNVLRLSRLRYDAGYSAYLEVLDAQRTANAAEQALIQNRWAQLMYSVDLMKALGGGWSAEAVAKN